MVQTYLDDQNYIRLISRTAALGGFFIGLRLGGIRGYQAVLGTFFQYFIGGIRVGGRVRHG